MNNYIEKSQISDKEMSTARFDEQGILYSDKYNVLIKCPRNINHINVHPNTTIIANYAFAGCNIKNIVLPTSIKIIGHHAFHYSSLERIEIPNCVQFIGHNAFRSCEHLSYISLSSQLGELQENTFLRCKSLNQICIPKSVSLIGGGCFSGCFNINLQIESEDFKVYQKCLYQISTKSLISCWNNNNHLHLADGLLRIENNAFMTCKHFETIRIPNTVKYIGNNLFGACGVSDIYIPNSVELIEPFAFNHNVKRIYIPIGQSERFKLMLPSSYHKILYEIN